MGRATAMRTLIICEKNDAAKQIAKALSGGKAKQRPGGGVATYEWEGEGATWVCMGLRGHIVELDFAAGHRRWSIQPDKLHALVDAGIEKQVTEEAIVKVLQDQAGRADAIIVATDYDREGELIGVEALEVLGKRIASKSVLRAKYSSFTPKEVQAAFSHLQEVDHHLADAGKARQAIDLAWGAALTRYLSVAGGARGGNFLSVGRVQTPTLGLVVDREKERLAFQPQAYWEVEADLDAEIPFTAMHEKSGYKTTKVEDSDEERGFSLEGRFGNLREAEAAVAAIRKAGRARVAGVEGRERTVRAPAPFSTTLFQAECSSRLGMGVKRAMDIAQRLYLTGLISYHRTENTVYPPTLDLDELVVMLQKGPTAKDAKWVAQNRRAEPTRGKKEATDHPPIYPTAVPGTDAKLGDQDLKVWELIARRFLATLSPDAKVLGVTVRVEAAKEPLRATGQTTVEAGWRRVYPYAAPEDRPMPELEAGMELPVRQVRIAAKETQPPTRYGQGSLIAKMEELGIGTKATRHEMIQKLIDRNYITESPVAPTTVGFAVTDALEQHAPAITTADMTARLEAEMDEIAQARRTLEETIADSRGLLHKVVDTLIEHKEPISAAVRKALDADAFAGTCPSCGRELQIRANRFGGRFIGCKGYSAEPKCLVTYNLPPRGKVVLRAEPCATCGAPYVQYDDRGRKSEFCANAECPTRQEQAAAERITLGTCPTCRTGLLEVTRSRNFKRFVKCNNPDCPGKGDRPGPQTYPLPQKGNLVTEGVTCETCGAPRVKIVTPKRKPWDICINMECPTNQKVAKPEAAGA
ncbi:MAG: DNA topoisomerase I [Thermoplasmatota archaeon]